MFSGAIVAIVTPFKNGKVDEKGLDDLIEFQINNGIKGIVPCGTTGESATLTHEEHKLVVELTVKKVDKRVPVIAGTGSNSTKEAIEFTQHASEAGADGALIITPYYNKPTQEGLYQHFKNIAQNVDIPIVLYNVPSRTGVNMLPETVARLSGFDNITAIKEASGSMQQVTDIIRFCGDSITLISGEDYLTYPILAVGGKGVISVASNIAPGEMSRMCDAFFEGETKEAYSLYYKLIPLCHAMFYETNPAPVKTALGLMGKISDELRLPLCPMSVKNIERLKVVLKDFGLI